MRYCVAEHAVGMVTPRGFVCKLFAVVRQVSYGVVEMQMRQIGSMH